MVDKSETKEKIRIHPGNMRWNCKKCDSLLGFVDQTNSTVRLKYKDHYVQIESGKISVMCRRCGFLNTIADSDYVLFEDFRIPLKRILGLKNSQKLKNRKTLEKIISILN